MSKLNPIFMLLFLLASSILPTWAATMWMPHCSYLPRSVSDAHDFAQLLRENRAVAQRFADHYGMNNDAIADYIEQNGKVVTISKPTGFVEYYIDKSGATHKHQKTLHAGDKILTVRGTPVLDMMCGNPMSRILPPVPTPSKPIPAGTFPPPPTETTTPSVEITEKPLTPPLPPAAVMPPPPPVAEVLPPPTLIPAHIPGEIPGAVTRRSGPFPWFLLAGLFTIHGGHNAPPTPPGPPPVVPEASSLALGIGGMGFILTYFRMRGAK